jgi:hypothetical protein
MSAATTRHKRGDLSPCGKLRFWQYQAHIKADGTQAQHWIPKHSFEAKKIHVNQTQTLARAKRDWNEMLRARRAK